MRETQEIKTRASNLPPSRTKSKNTWILVVYSTRFPEAFALPESTAETTAKSLIENIFLRYGPPRVILSDQGANFLSDLVTNICELFEAHQVNSSGYRPQTAGLVERFNQTLVDILAIYTDAEQTNCDEFIPYALFAYRTTFNPAIQDTPLYFIYYMAMSPSCLKISSSYLRKQTNPWPSSGETR